MMPVSKPDELVLGVSDFVALLNQTMEYAYPSVVVQGELANFRVSKNRWVYFDLKDEYASVKCFGTVYLLPGPLEDGMLLSVRATPRLHQLYGFSLNVSHIQPTGEGALRRAAELLEAKLAAEGLFDESRKRYLPYPPARIGLVTSSESAAYADFMKILSARWGGMDIQLVDVQVQGEAAPGQIVQAIEAFNMLPEPPEVIVLTRGGGSAEDLAAFSTEQVTRAVAASRVPTLVAIGHEVDISLAELAADQRASTPSNAAEMLVPDRKEQLRALGDTAKQLQREMRQLLAEAQEGKRQLALTLHHQMTQHIRQAASGVQAKRQLLDALSPQAVLERGYAIVRRDTRAVRSARELHKGDTIELRFADGTSQASVE